MVRSASEILRDLEIRVARLERQAVRITDIIPESAYKYFVRRVDPHDLHGKTWKELETARPDLQKDISFVLKRNRLEQKMEPVFESRGWKRDRNGVWGRDGVAVTHLLGKNEAQTLRVLDALDRARELVDDYVSGRTSFSTGSFPAPYPASKYYGILFSYDRNTTTATDYFKDLLVSKGGTINVLR